MLIDALRRCDRRTEVIIRLAAELGLRRSEIAQLHTRDIQPVASGWQITVNGKGGKLRVLPCTRSLGAVIRMYAEENSIDSGYLFPGSYGGHLSPRWISQLASKVLTDPWTLHTLRHRFATIAYSKGGNDLLAVKQALGHEDVATTQRYTECDPHKLDQLVEVTTLP